MAVGAMVSILGKVIVELRSATAVAAIVGDRVYGAEAGDEADGVAFVLVRRLGPERRKPRSPMTSGRLSVDCYGRTYQEATNLYLAVSDALSAKGPRKSPAGVALYLTVEEVGGQSTIDPDSKQPVERAIYGYSAPLAQAS
jgi:hypothetical protein